MTTHKTQNVRTTLHERMQAGTNAVVTNHVDGDSCVVLCPPHPQYGGTKHDPRLKAVADALNRQGLSEMRFDYGDWTGGEGETRDAVNAVEHSRERWSHVGLFGYSFGAGIAARTSEQIEVEALGLLAPPPEAADYLPELPLIVVAGRNDTTLDSSPVMERASEAEWVDSNHFFTGVKNDVAERFAGFFDQYL